jgi:hypothetical protein
MTVVEEVVVVRASAPQVRRAFSNTALMARWVAPDVSVQLASATRTLLPGERFRLSVLAGLRFDYLVEAESEREVALSFSGPWNGRECWSFVADGPETIVRRRYEVDDRSLLLALGFRTVGWAVVTAHLKIELMRFRDLVEHSPGVRAEIPGRAEVERSNPPRVSDEWSPEAHRDVHDTTPPFPVDEG